MNFFGLAVTLTLSAFMPLAVAASEPNFTHSDAVSIVESDTSLKPRRGSDNAIPSGEASHPAVEPPAQAPRKVRVVYPVPLTKNNGSGS